MKSNGNGPTYLVRNPHSFCFRMFVPKDLHTVIGKKELRYSLKTGSIGLAKYRARIMAGIVQSVFRQLRRGGHMAALTDQQIQEILHKGLRELLAESEEYKVIRAPLTHEELAHQAEIAKARKAMLIDNLARSDYSDVDYIIEFILKKEGIQLDRDSFEFKKLCREELKLELEFVNAEQRQINGDYSQPLPLLAEVATQPMPPSITLEALYEEFKAKKLESKSWKESTERNHKPKFISLLQFVGDVPINTITKPMLIEYSKLLDCLPPRYPDFPEYKDLSKIKPEDIKGKHDKTMDITTKRDYLVHIKAIFDYAKDYEYIDRNPVDGLIPAKKKQARQQREAFTLDELKLIFDPANYPLNDKKAHRFWVPILGLYTGCRLEELCQLYTEDVYQEDGIWVLDINNKVDKQIKNEASARLVPLHPVLTDNLRFPQFVEAVQKQGHERVFWELRKYNGKYGHKVTDWFGQYRKKVGIQSAPGVKVFHSFRHNVTDHLYKRMVDVSLIEELTGRAGKTETQRRYAKGHLVENLYKKAVLELDYHINLKFMYNSNYPQG